MKLLTTILSAITALGVLIHVVYRYKENWEKYELRRQRK